VALWANRRFRFVLFFRFVCVHESTTCALSEAHRTAHSSHQHGSHATLEERVSRGSPSLGAAGGSRWIPGSAAPPQQPLAPGGGVAKPRSLLKRISRTLSRVFRPAARKDPPPPAHSEGGAAAPPADLPSPSARAPPAHATTIHGLPSGNARGEPPFPAAARARGSASSLSAIAVANLAALLSERMPALAGPLVNSSTTAGTIPGSSKASVVGQSSGFMAPASPGAMTASQLAPDATPLTAALMGRG
jgi:hypothetical protein